MPKKPLVQQIQEVRLEHQRGTATEKYHPTTGGAYIKDIVYGANDGIVTTFAMVAGITGANLSAKVVLILGFVNLFAAGLSMALGNYLGTKSELEYIDRERKMEEWEIKHIPDLEKQEIKAIYRKKGYRGKQLQQITNLITSNKKAWVDTMLVDELGVLPLGDTNPVKKGSVTFFAFVIAGLAPLLPYLLSFASAFNLAIIFTALTLFIVGALRVFIIRKHWFIAGLEMLFVGAIAAIAAYTTGYFINQKLL